MSILKSSSNGWIISHRDYIKIALLDDDLNDKSSKIMKLNPDLFEIHCPFKDQAKVRNFKKKPQQSCESTGTNDKATDIIVPHNQTCELSDKDKCDNGVTSEVKKISDGLVKEGKDEGLFQTSPSKLKTDNNATARKAANTFYEQISSLKKFPKFIRELPEHAGVKMILFDATGNFQNFIIPEDSRLYCDDVENLSHFLGNESFSLIVMDPPWRNKYIRRRKRKQSEAGYQMMDDWNIQRIPIKNIAKDNALVAIWCTNSDTHQQRVIQHFFPSWNVQYISTWYWLKVTTEGVPVCPFNTGTKKQPYESIILGRKRCNPLSEFVKIPEDKETLSAEIKVLISVPSSIHSHKPPLTEVLRSFIFESEINSTNCCEIFARYALPGFTCFGNEVVKLMHESLYICDQEDEKQSS